MSNPAVQAACTQVGHILADLLNPEMDGGQKVSSSMAVSMAAVTITATTIMEGFNAKEDKLPNEDHILFAALLVWHSCQIGERGRIAVEFGPDVIFTTMDYYEKITGQSARPILNKNMMEAMDRVGKVDSSKFGANSKFLPN